MLPESRFPSRGVGPIVLGLVLALLAGTAWAQTGDPHAPADSGLIQESAEAMKVTTVIQCFCGTCSNQTLHDCTCGTASRERAKVEAALAAGETSEALIARYVEEHGPQVRIVPELQGLDIIGYSMPFAAAVAGLLILYRVLRGWQRRGPVRALSTAGREADGGYREMLERDLREID